MVDIIRSIWRPVTGWVIVGGFVLGSFFNAEAAANLKDPVLVVLSFYFLERAIQKAVQAERDAH